MKPSGSWGSLGMGRMPKHSKKVTKDGQRRTAHTVGGYVTWLRRSEIGRGFNVMGLGTAELPSPAEVGDVTNADLTDGVGKAAASGKMHVDLAELGRSLLACMASLA